MLNFFEENTRESNPTAHKQIGIKAIAILKTKVEREVLPNIRVHEGGYLYTIMAISIIRIATTPTTCQGGIIELNPFLIALGGIVRLPERGDWQQIKNECSYNDHP